MEIILKCISLIFIENHKHHKLINFFFILVIQRLLGGDVPANKVQEVKADALENLQILYRDDGMVLYAPPFGSTDKKVVYEIVIHRPYAEMNTSFR